MTINECEVLTVYKPIWETTKLAWALCHCGEVFSTRLQNLKSGNTKSCGCLWNSAIRNTKHMHDISGMSFGLLTVRRFDCVKKGNAYWVCQCECGNIVSIIGLSLKSGTTRSCGCLRITAFLTHGESRSNILGNPTTEYRAWQGMKYRCYNPNASKWKRYGGRGIIVCARWLESYENFLADMGRKPSPEMSLDRFPDRNGNYEPSNCRWATKVQQSQNRDYYDAE